MSRLRIVVLWLTICVALVFSAPGAFAFDEAIIGQAERAAVAFRTDLQRIEADLALPTTTDQQLVERRNSLEDIRSKATQQSLALDGPIKEMGAQVAKLGPVPPAGQSESAEIQAQRKLLTDIFNRLQGAKAQLELVSVEAEQQSGRASAIQRDQFFSRIFEPSRSILNPFLWADSALGASVFLQRVGGLLSNWWTTNHLDTGYSKLTAIPAIIIVVAGLWWGLMRFLHTRFSPFASGRAYPDNLERLWRLLRAIVGSTLVALAIWLLVWTYFEVSGLSSPRFELLVDAVGIFVANLVSDVVLIYRLASPQEPKWRLINLDDAAASRFVILGCIASVLADATSAFSDLADGLYMPVTYSIGLSAITSLAMILTLALIVINFANQKGMTERAGDHALYFGWAPALKAPIWLIILAAALALLSGYIALSNFLVFRVFDTAGLIVVLTLLQSFADAVVQKVFDPISRFGQFIRRFTGLGERAIERVALLFRTAVDILLVMFGLPALILMWAVTWIDFRALTNKVFSGFAIGDINISPWSIIVVALVLLLGVALTKLFVSWMNRRILSETRIDKGVQDSVRTGATYTGYILTAGFAATAAGFDFSSLAIIAGALGVGIGFGLQSIVNNFVSGLIVLAERPVRVGDWVAMPAGEGLIRRIKVRATEIETFDGCSIVVPNSNFITEPVKNWTLHDTMGRFSVMVTVVYGSDVEKVKDTLMQCARQHPKVLTYPEPVVTLGRFGPYGLDFDVKATVADIFDGILVSSDVRFAVLQAFAEAGIVIAQAPPPPPVSK